MDDLDEVRGLILASRGRKWFSSVPPAPVANRPWVQGMVSPAGVRGRAPAGLFTQKTRFYSWVFFVRI